MDLEKDKFHNTNWKAITEYSRQHILSQEDGMICTSILIVSMKYLSEQAEKFCEWVKSIKRDK
jgi:hypothetical protein